MKKICEVIQWEKDESVEKDGSMMRRMGLGGTVNMVDEENSYHQRGDDVAKGTYTWGGAFCTKFIVNRDTGVTVVFSSNTRSSREVKSSFEKGVFGPHVRPALLPLLGDEDKDKSEEKGKEVGKEKSDGAVSNGAVSNGGVSNGAVNTNNGAVSNGTSNGTH